MFECGLFLSASAVCLYKDDGFLHFGTHLIAVVKKPDIYIRRRVLDILIVPVRYNGNCAFVFRNDLGQVLLFCDTDLVREEIRMSESGLCLWLLKISDR